MQPMRQEFKTLTYGFLTRVVPIFPYFCNINQTILKMIKHIVFWKLKDEALGNDKATNALLIKEKLEALNGQIEGLLKLEVGIDFVGGAMSGDCLLYTSPSPRD